MVKRKRRFVFSTSLILMLVVTGCNLRKEKDQENNAINSEQNPIEIEIQVPEKMPVSIQVEDGDVIDLDGLLGYFYGQDKQTLLNTGYVKEDKYQGETLGFHCDKDGVQLHYAYPPDSEEVGGRNYFEVNDGREAAGDAYARILTLFDSQEGVSNRFKSLFSEIDLEDCSREEAIRACAPIANACGYGEAQVSVYAMTEEALNKLAYDRQNSPEVYYYLNPPSQDATKWDNTIKGDAWTKQHEAYVVVYQTVINGLIVDSDSYYLYCVYVPAYEKVVLAEGEQSLRLVSTMETTPLAIQKESLLQTIQSYQKEGNGTFGVTHISMVYAPKYAKMNSGLEVRIIDPCWRIDYVVDESSKYSPGYDYDDWTIVVNAVDGSIVKYSGRE